MKKKEKKERKTKYMYIEVSKIKKIKIKLKFWKLKKKLILCRWLYRNVREYSTQQSKNNRKINYSSIEQERSSQDER